MDRMESWMAFVSGAAGAALVAGIFGLVQFLINRKDKKNEQGRINFVKLCSIGQVSPDCSVDSDLCNGIY